LTVSDFYEEKTMRINISIDTTDEEFNHFLESCRKTDSAFSAPSTAAKESADAELAVSDEVLANFSRVLDEQLEECEKWEAGIVPFTLRTQYIH
jgi:hypothetical protein